MLTIFACPRPFKGLFAIIQRNAIISWTLLRPQPEIILFADEEGTAEICREFSLRHVPEVARSGFGSPLVSDLFQRAQGLAKYDLICYVNADIILTQNLIAAIGIVRQRWLRFFIFCSPWKLDIDKELNFTFPDWEDKLRNLVQENGRTPDPDVGVDLFLFPRGFYRHIPPFGIGRLYWDAWLIFKACSEKIPFIDATKFVLTVHSNHKYSAHDDGCLLNEEHYINQRLAGWWPRTFAKIDIPYTLERNGQLRKKRVLELLRLRMNAIKFFPPLSRLRLRQRISYFLQKI